jgi:hypothetical protein
MVSPLFFYQLVLVALVWLCVMLHWAWPSDPATVRLTTLEGPVAAPGAIRRARITRGVDVWGHGAAICWARAPAPSHGLHAARASQVRHGSSPSRGYARTAQPRTAPSLLPSGPLRGRAGRAARATAEGQQRACAASAQAGYRAPRRSATPPSPQRPPGTRTDRPAPPGPGPTARSSRSQW